MYRAALWIIGEYAISTEDIDVAFSTINDEIGPLPFFKPPKAKGQGGDSDDEQDDNEKDERGPAKTSGNNYSLYASPITHALTPSSIS